MIQIIKMFLRTSFGISSTYYTGTELHPFQGGIQGNGTAPPLWLIISIFLVRYLYDSKWVSIWRISISNSTYALLGFLYVDDIDILALN